MEKGWRFGKSLEEWRFFLRPLSGVNGKKEGELSTRRGGYPQDTATYPH